MKWLCSFELFWYLIVKCSVFICLVEVGYVGLFLIGNNVDNVLLYLNVGIVSVCCGIIFVVIWCFLCIILKKGKFFLLVWFVRCLIKVVINVVLLLLFNFVMVNFMCWFKLWWRVFFVLFFNELKVFFVNDWFIKCLVFYLCLVLWCK